METDTHYKGGIEAEQFNQKVIHHSILTTNSIYQGASSFPIFSVCICGDWYFLFN